MNTQSTLGSSWLVALLLAFVTGLSPLPSAAESPSAPSGLEARPVRGAQVQPADSVPASDWWTAAQEDIRSMEYHITWQETTYLEDVPAAYQAPNRAHNLRTYFAAAGPVIISRTWSEEAGGPPWRLDLRLAAWGRQGALKPVSPAMLEVEENRIEYRRVDLVESYRNDEDGLEQVFSLMSPPGDWQPGSSLQLQMELAFGGDLVPVMSEDGEEVEFRTAAGDAHLRYGGLQAVDATGQLLPSSLSLRGSTLSILVEDAEAIYPVEVDPSITGLPPDHQWSISFGQPGAMFATSVATAGDVDGDGYSEVIVGAPDYDNGGGEEGAAFVYYGSREGLYVAPDWLKAFDQAGAHYGRSVATAGDVNGDGYADVIVGAPDYTNGQNGEGGIWVYYGSSDGLQHAGFDHKESNVGGAQFGFSVATAGDLNGEEDGDYFSDVIVGAPTYTAGQVNEGRVYVWHGSADGLVGAHDWYAEGNETGLKLGQSVATAGDVNRDGFADIIVGAVGYSVSSTYPGPWGAAYVWHGSTNGVNNGTTGTLDNYAWRNTGMSNYMQLGFSVSTAGDVNGDGYADVIVGGPCPDPDLLCTTPLEGGLARVFLGSSSGLASSPANEDYGEHAGASFGWSVGTAGDVNGDGYADVIVGSPHYTDGQSEEGHAYVWYGQPTSSGISGYRDWDREGGQVDAYYGAAVATAGDVDGDGYSDIIVGAPGYASSAGRAYVYHGGPDNLSETAGWTKPSNQENALFGTSVGTAGDVNGDGYADVIVGAPRWDGGQPFEGAAWVYQGNATGLESAPSWYRRSNQAYAEFGTSVGTAGDVNGDGYDDVIVGAPYWTSGQDDEGAAWVYNGSASGLDQSAPPLWSKASNQAGAQFGTSAGTAGDVNGDGYADIIVGAPYWRRNDEERGAAWLYYGSDGGPHSAPDWHTVVDQEDAQFGYAVGTAGDVNGDGYSDVIIGAPYWEDDVAYPNEGRVWVYLGSRSGLRYDVHWHAEGNNYTAQLGHSVGTAGDVDGDGFSDVIVGAPGYGDDGLTGEGKVWVFHGSTGGLEPSSSWRKEGGQSGAHYGWSVGTAGDVNGDGFADIIIGIEGWNGGAGLGDAGRASLYYGSYGGLEDSLGWSAESGQASAHYGYSVGTAGDVNGDGYAEVIVGAPNYQRITGPLDEGQAFLYYGNGRKGVALRPLQRTENSSPLAHLGRLDAFEPPMVRLLSKSPFGLGATRLEVEFKPVGVPFDGVDAWVPAIYSRWQYSYSAYVWWPYLVPDMPYHWRLRWHYDPVTTPWMPASRWITQPWNGWNETDLRAGGSRALLPVVVKEYSPED